jgi:hypothetical protein
LVVEISIETKSGKLFIAPKFCLFNLGADTGFWEDDGTTGGTTGGTTVSSEEEPTPVWMVVKATGQWMLVVEGTAG